VPHLDRREHIRGKIRILRDNSRKFLLHDHIQAITRGNIVTRMGGMLPPYGIQIPISLSPRLSLS
jgi:hypothetical protein